MKGASAWRAFRRGEEETVTGRVGRPLRTIQIMTDITASSLRNLAVSTSPVPVIDELAGFDALLPDLPD